jgi:hypothetical protein
MQENFTYKQAIEHLADYWYLNPQYIPNFEDKYNELADSDKRLPDNPKEAYREYIDFFAYTTMFGEKFFTYDESVEYCFNARLKLLSQDFNKKDADKLGLLDQKQIYELLGDSIPSSLQVFYKDFRKDEPRLPSNPAVVYKAKGWDSVRTFFGLTEEVTFFTYNEAFEYCTEKYNALPDNEKSINLRAYYSDLRGFEYRLPARPEPCYKAKGWNSFRTLFGLEDKELFTCDETQYYCTETYNALPVDKKSISLTDFYQQLRAVEPKLPSNPTMLYKNKGINSYFKLFGLENIEYFTYEEALEYCTGKYSELTNNKKPINLKNFYLVLRKKEPRLRSCPDKFYKDKGWVGSRELFGLEG